MQTKSFRVPNISCGHCVHTIQNEVGELPDVSRVTADQETQMVVVEWQEPQNWQNIETLLKEINYPPEN